jgi:hypothetical protein
MLSGLFAAKFEIFMLLIAAHFETLPEVGDAYAYANQL